MAIPQLRRRLRRLHSSNNNNNNEEIEDERVEAAAAAAAAAGVKKGVAEGVAVGRIALKTLAGVASADLRDRARSLSSNAADKRLRVMEGEIIITITISRRTSRRFRARATPSLQRKCERSRRRSLPSFWPKRRRRRPSRLRLLLLLVVELQMRVHLARQLGAPHLPRGTTAKKKMAATASSARRPCARSHSGVATTARCASTAS